MTSPATFFLTVAASCFATIVICLGAAIYEARKRPPTKSREITPRPTSWPNPYRPMHCSRCHEAELVEIPHILLRCDEASADRDVITTQAQVCSACGKVEWFIVSASEIAPRKQDT
jgi:hypothetical protein